MRRIRHVESSSTKLALLFSGLLAFAAVLLGVEMYALTHDESIHPIYSRFVLVLIILVSGSLFFVSFYVTKRINVIAQTATRIINTSDLSQRIPLDARWDDLSKLALTLNTMLEEIEQLVSGIRTLSDNIAHDLRHPLTRLRNRIESMRKDSPDNTELQQKLGELTLECDALLTTFQALLRISNIESGKRSSGFKAMDFTKLMQDVVELYEPVAADKNITLQFLPLNAQVVGDKDLLFQAFTNLIDNAIKYTPTEGIVTVAMQPQEKGARVVIRDTGLGVSDEHKDRVFRRFYRVEHSRRLPGSGLGLSLVAAIIKLHSGIIQLHDNSPQGLAVTVTL
jgi:signal transduction histidine kinase